MFTPWGCAMRATELLKSVWGSATPANAANPANPRLNTGAEPIANGCESCESPPAYRPALAQIRKIRNPFASLQSRMDAGDSQHSQDSQPSHGGNANDAPRPLPGEIVPAADPFDREQFGIECLSYLHAHGLALALEAGQIVAHGIASPQIVEEAAALVELHRADLLAALQAQEAAQQAIQRAAVSCAQCRHLRASASARDRRPGCNAGHRLVYRTTTTRTWPGRADAQGCNEREDSNP